MMRLAWWRKKKAEAVSWDKALRALRGIRRQQRGLNEGMSRNDGYSTPDHSRDSGAGGGWL